MAAVLMVCGSIGLFAGSSAAFTPLQRQQVEAVQPVHAPWLRVSSKRCHNRKRKCRGEEKTIHGTRGPAKDAALGVGGGFGFVAPWPADVTLVAGGKCGYFYKQGDHRDYGGTWHDDRFAVDFGLCGGRDAEIPVLSVLDGTVAVADQDQVAGNEVVVESDGGPAVRYSHLAQLTVKEGETVFVGEKVGTIGHSGEGGGGKGNSHLHFALYSSRGPHKGIKPDPLAGLHLCNGCRITSLTQPPNPDSLPFRAALDSQFPMDAGGGLAIRAGDTAQIGFDLRFSQPFLADRFVLRPKTEDLAKAFLGNAGDIVGQGDPGAPTTGRYRATLLAPAGIAPGQYVLQWEAVDTATGRSANLRLTIRIGVSPAAAVAVDAPPCSPVQGGSLPGMSPSPLQASLDAQFPMDSEGKMHVSRGDTVPFGFNIRFNAPYSSSFVLKPNTVGAVDRFVLSFGTPGNVFPGTISPNDDHVGYWRSVATVPTCVPPGQYLVQWRVVNEASGQDAGLEPSFVLVVP